MARPSGTEPCSVLPGILCCRWRWEGCSCCAVWNYYNLVAPGCLVFYGLALVNASKYTLGEIRYLGYGQLILGIINLWQLSYGLYFWAAGFGILHIIYGIVMWYRHERASGTN